MLVSVASSLAACCPPVTLSPAAAERWLARWLRLGGVVCASALVAVIMPRDWHLATHAALGLGDFPQAPIAEYLARGMSGMCAFYGLLLLGLARDVRAHKSLIVWKAIALMGISLLATFALATSGMPAWWLYGDLVSVVGFSVVTILLAWATRSGTDD